MKNIKKRGRGRYREGRRGQLSEKGTEEEEGSGKGKKGKGELKETASRGGKREGKRVAQS